MSYKSVIVGVLLVATLGLAVACGGGASTTASSARQATTPTPVGTPKLDPAVAMPSGFPADVPIYPGARLTAAASFTGTGQTTWGLNWETPDSIAKVQAFYSTKLNQGDWSITFSSNTPASFAATFNRKSNSRFGGLLGADGSSGVSRITMSLANAA
jgi:hypothetical protein